MSSARQERYAFRRLIRLALVERDEDGADLARALGWSSSRLSQYLTGSRRPSAEDVTSIAAALELDPEELTAALADTSPPSPQVRFADRLARMEAREAALTRDVEELREQLRVAGSGGPQGGTGARPKRPT